MRCWGAELKSPSKERGCDGKANIGSSYERAAEMLAHKHGKRYGVYRCPHCGGHHLTTKLEKRGEYAPLLYVTFNPKGQGTTHKTEE